MLTYKEILYSFTKKLSSNYKDIDIYTSETLQGFEGSCFFVQLLPVFNNAVNNATDEKSLMVEISYFLDKGDNVLTCYEKLNELQQLFVRGIKIKDRFLKFAKIEHNILKDEIGYRLSFMITINYNEGIYIEKEYYELMMDIKIALNNGERKLLNNEKDIEVLTDKGDAIIFNLNE